MTRGTVSDTSIHRNGIDKVAADHEQIAAGKLIVPEAAERRAGEEQRDDVRRVEPSSDIRHAVEPELLGAGMLLRQFREQRLRLSLVRVAGQDSGEEHPRTGQGQPERSSHSNIGSRGKPSTWRSLTRIATKAFVIEWSRPRCGSPSLEAAATILNRSNAPCAEPLTDQEHGRPRTSAH